MNKTWLLVKTMLKMQYSKAGTSQSQIWLYVVAGIFLLPVLFILIPAIQMLVTAMYEVLAPANQESLILGMLLLGLHILLFMISLVTVINSFYFAEDIQSFIPLPLQPYQLLLAKAANPFLYLYLTAGAVFLPVFYFYGLASDASFLYFLYGIPVFLLLPLIPFTIASLLLMPVMRFVNISKNKDRSKVAGGILSLLFIIFINVLIRLNTDTDGLVENVALSLQEGDGLLRMLTIYYPPAYISTLALSNPLSLTGILSFAGMIAMSAAALVLFLWMGQLLYLKGLLGTGSGNKRPTASKKVQKKISARPVWLSYLQKELRIIFRTPAFLMQCVVQSLFGPVFIVIILMLDFENNSFSGLLGGFSGKQTILLLFIATVFIMGSNGTAISSVSREGKNWHANLFLPLKPAQYFFSKIAAAWVINLFTVLLALFIFVFFLQLPVGTLLAWLLVVLLASWFTSAVGTYLDFLDPKLNWTDEQEVFKWRITSLLSLLITAGPFGLIVLVLWRVNAVEGLYVTSLVLLVILAISILIIHQLLRKKINTNWQQQI
ncbi:putative ABC transporter permease subunit [Lentibacillus sediminis]|uniref:putative ABC transporter permease subunit n=1 Tax=Lentibacillus sediminis TaxID=1940529 RepID=UPI000C1BEAC0|nr:ABC transporter permease [Lentibacillus sediminis]